MRKYIKNVFAVIVLFAATVVGTAQPQRVPSSSMPCTDAFVNAMYSEFAMSDMYPPNSKKHHKLDNKGFTFADVALTMYGGDHSQDSKLCTVENLKKLEVINTFLDTPHLSWRDKQKIVEDQNMKRFDLEQSAIYANQAEHYLKSK